MNAVRVTRGWSSGPRPPVKLACDQVVFDLAPSASSSDELGLELFEQDDADPDFAGARPADQVDGTRYQVSQTRLGHADPSLPCDLREERQHGTVTRSTVVAGMRTFHHATTVGRGTSGDHVKPHVRRSAPTPPVHFVPHGQLYCRSMSPAEPPREPLTIWPVLRALQFVLIGVLSLVFTTETGFRQVIGYAGLAYLALLGSYWLVKATRAR